jgi:hypothetical protein
MPDRIVLTPLRRCSHETPRKHIAVATLQPALKALRELGLLTCLGFLLHSVAISQTPEKNYRVLDNAAIGRLRNSAAEPTVMLDLNLARLQPSLIAGDAPFLNYFMMLNNCGDMGMLRALKSEFDYPAMAGFYKAKASEILSSVALPVGAMSPPFFLGDYDAARKAFPFVGYGRPGAPRKPVKLGSLTIHADRGGLPCANALMAIPGGAFNSVLSGAGPFYTVRFDANNEFAELPMDEAHAREYVAGLRGAGRMVTLLIDFDILSQPPASTTTGGFVYINLAGTLKKVTAVKTAMPNAVLGTLYP